MPDCLRAFAKKELVSLRSPQAVRPWQHVLEPIAGYLQLAEKLMDPNGARLWAQHWNFGPDIQANARVADVAETLARVWVMAPVCKTRLLPQIPTRPACCVLTILWPARFLGWQPRWPLEVALENTVAWFKAFLRDRI